MSLSRLVTETSAAIKTVVRGIAADRGRRDDRVGDVAVDERIVDAGDGDGLRRVPVGRGEGQATPARPCPRSCRWTLRAIVTSAVGWEFRTTVKVAVPPASVVVRPEVGLTVMPAVSLSMLVTETSAALRPSYSGIVAGRRCGDDGVGDVAVVDEVVDAGDGHGLGRVPVGRGEGQG